MAITNKIGAPVTGEDFFGRVNELAKAHRYIDEQDLTKVFVISCVMEVTGNFVRLC